MDFTKLLGISWRDAYSTFTHTHYVLLSYHLCQVVKFDPCWSTRCSACAKTKCPYKSNNLANLTSWIENVISMVPRIYCHNMIREFVENEKTTWPNELGCYAYNILVMNAIIINNTCISSSGSIDTTKHNTNSLDSALIQLCSILYFKWAICLIDYSQQWLCMATLHEALS